MPWGHKLTFPLTFIMETNLMTRYECSSLKRFKTKPLIDTKNWKSHNIILLDMFECPFVEPSRIRSFFYLIIWLVLTSTYQNSTTNTYMTTHNFFLHEYVCYIYLTKFSVHFSIEMKFVYRKVLFKKKYILLLFLMIIFPLLSYFTLTHCIYFKYLVKVKSLASHCFSHLMVNLKYLSL